MSNENLTLQEKVVKHIQVSSSALEKAATDQATQEATQVKVAALVPEVVNALVDGDRIKESEREKAAQILQDPVRALELLKNVATHSNAAEASIGSSVDAATKQASATPAYNSETDCRVGMRTTQPKASDLAFSKGLGLQS